MMRFIDRYFIKQPRLRRLVTRILEGDHTKNVRMLGTELCVNSIKEHGYLRASRMVESSALLREEIPVIINLASIFSNGDTFVDVGANVGIYSLTFARLRRVMPDTYYYAFEASPDTFSRLKAHAEAAGVRVHNVAISDHDGTLEFIHGSVSHVFTSAENTSSYSIPTERISLPCRRLDGFKFEGDSLVIKIDVEGQEKNVLDGAEGLFRGKRVKAVYIDGYKERSVEDFLRGFGFVLLDGKTLLPASHDTFSLLAVRRDV